MRSHAAVKILFIHQNFPGQFRHLAPALALRKGTQIVGLGERESPKLSGIAQFRYKSPAPAGEKTHRYLRPTEAAIRRGQTTAQACHSLKMKGFVPDVICCHPGWGEGLYLRDVFPDARLLMYCEFYYSSAGADVGFDPKHTVSLDEAARVRTMNLTQLLSLEAADWAVSPTEWQRSRYPAMLQERISVVHEGVDTAFSSPNGPAEFKLPDGRILGREDEVVSFVSRNLEPYRGFDVFMQALPEIQARRPRAQAVIVGGEDRGYGRLPEGGGSWKAKILGEVGSKLDLSRVHFTGRVPHPSLQALFRISSAHTYFSYPFVLSWSMLEAMACGALLLGSATAPVQEVLRHGENGLLLPFHDPEALASAVADALSNPSSYVPLREAARRTVLEKYDLTTVCLPQQIALVNAVAAGKPGSAAMQTLAA